MRTQFCIYGEPRGKERPKFSTVCGHVTARTPENTVLYENLVKTEYRIQSGVRFADDAMLSVRIFAFLSVPRSASRKKHLAMIDRLIRPTRKPDFDNIGKIICDALNGIAYRDDAQIVDALVRKFYSDTPRVIVEISDIPYALTEIFSKRLQPSITAQPSIGTFTLTGAGAVEAGTKVAAAAYSGATLNAGSYQYGPATGVTATNWKVERITNAATTQVTTADAASLTAGSDNNGGAGFIIGDAGDNAVSSLKYRVTATHGAGVTAKDNLGAASSPVVAIAAGSKTKDTAAYTPFRNVFYGASTGKPALDSAAIRALGKTGKAYAAGVLTINVPVGAQRVAIACIATAKGVTKVINETAMNADVTSTFTKSTVSVEGANGYAAKDYNVWVFEPAVAYGNAAVLKVTLG